MIFLFLDNTISAPTPANSTDITRKIPARNFESGQIKDSLTFSGF
jgi:hypothetical protein